MTPLPNVHKILLIRLRRIGDLVTVTPCTRALKEAYPESSLAVLVEEEGGDIFRGNPYVDEILVWEKRREENALRRVWREMAFLFTVWRRHFDLVVNLHGGPRSAFLTAVSGARYRVGGFLSWHHWNWVYNIRVRAERDAAGRQVARHIVERHLHSLRSAGVTASDPHLILPVLPQSQVAVARVLAASGMTDGEPLVTLYPAASSPLMRWKEERFAALADRLIETTGVRVALVGGREEKAVVERVAVCMRRPVLNLAGATSLQEMAALCERSALFIGVDGGPTHIAAAVGTPILALFGPTSHETWRPWTDRHEVLRTDIPCIGCMRSRCLFETIRCMEGITVEQVWEAACRVGRLGERMPRGRDNGG